MQSPWRIGGRALVVVGLLVGGVVLPVVGWLIAVVFLWLSPVWSNRQKLLGTLAPPGGLAIFAYLLLVGTSTRSCTGMARVGHAASLTCTTTGTHFAPAIGAPLVALSLTVPLITGLVLAQQLVRYADHHTTTAAA